MVKCAVSKCKSDSRKHTKKKNDISFHRFPKCCDMAKKWVAAIKRPNWEPNIRSFVCSVHFAASKIFETKSGLRKLVEGAIPELYLDVVTADVYPQFVCTLCKFQLAKFFNFRMRCHSAMYVIQQMQIAGIKISTESLSTAERSHLTPNLLQSEIQVISFDGSEESIKGGAEVLTNITIPKNIDLTEEEDEDDKPLIVREIVFNNRLKDEKIEIVDTDDDISDLAFLNDLQNSDLEDSKVETKTKNLKRKRAKIITNDNDIDSDKEIISKLKIPTKRRRVKRENLTRKNTTSNVARDITRKAKSKIKVEGIVEEDELLKTIANVLKSVWMKNKHAKNITDMWDLVHQESLCLKEDDNVTDPKDFSEWTVKQKIHQYMSLTKKLAKLYNTEVKFSSIAEQKKEIAERKLSEKYLNSPFKCEFCGKNYSFEDTYKRHMVSHDPISGDVECDICFYRFKNRKRYMTHFHTYHTKKIVCKTCGVISRAWNCAKQHFKWHGGATTVCEQCGKHFSERKLYCMHIRSVHRAELATALCLLCGDTYNGGAGLRMHLDKTHRQCERCPRCNTQFASADALAVHREQTRDAGCDGVSPCPQCGASFPSDEHMRDHYDKLHKKEFRCEQCGRLMDSLTQYTRHVRQCAARRRRGRPTRSEVRPRIPGVPREKGSAIINDGKKVYNLKLMCELCGKGNFKCFSTLRSHQRVHTGERPFQCEMCQKSFRELQFLKNHMMTHTDERRYKCPYCPKAFRQQGHRAAHILTHTKERPYACDTCSKRYTGQTALKEHVNTAHRGLPPRQRGKNRARQEL